jgi:hypothetical protein
VRYPRIQIVFVHVFRILTGLFALNRLVSFTAVGTHVDFGTRTRVVLRVNGHVVRRLMLRWINRSGVIRRLMGRLAHDNSPGCSDSCS